MESFELLKILEEFSFVKKEIEKMTNTLYFPSQSEELGELFKALSQAQAEMESADLNGKNPYFKSKYADLTSLVKASRPFLTKYGLAVLQHIFPNEKGENFLHTKLCHSSGQWIESRIRIVPPKNDIQTFGSYVTYLRRYSYAAIVGIVADNEDDDGEKAMESSRKQSTDEEYIGNEEKAILKSEFDKNTDIVMGVLKDFKIKKFGGIKKSNFSKIMKRIENIKNAKEVA